MDEIVLKAIAKWPKVPACFGWLGLDARGAWWMRDERAQSLGRFSSGIEGAKGSQLTHDKLIAFIGRNYGVEDGGAWAGCYFFQNGPQRVYVELQVTPWVWRVHNDYSVSSHTDQSSRIQRCVLDEFGALYLETDLGFGMVHTQDMHLAADALEQGLWVAQEMPRGQLPERFGYVRSPQNRIKSIEK